MINKNSLSKSPLDSFLTIQQIWNSQVQFNTLSKYSRINKQRKTNDFFHVLLKILSHCKPNRKKVRDLKQQVLRAQKIAIQKVLLMFMTKK